MDEKELTARIEHLRGQLAASRGLAAEHPYTIAVDGVTVEELLRRFHELKQDNAKARQLAAIALDEWQTKNFRYEVLQSRVREAHEQIRHVRQASERQRKTMQELLDIQTRNARQAEAVAKRFRDALEEIAYWDSNVGFMRNTTLEEWARRALESESTVEIDPVAIPGAITP